MGVRWVRWLSLLPLCAARSVVLGFAGRADACYDELLEELQSEGQRKGLEILRPQGRFARLEDMQGALNELLRAHPEADLVYMGHGMGEVGGASAAQAYAANSSAQALVLLAGFLERRWRPAVAACGATWAQQPTIRCPKGLCPGGYLKDGVHNCSGGPAVAYPLPSLSIGGELDGVVRVSRLAEAWYTQRQSRHVVRVVRGMSHSDLLSHVPAAVRTRDLASELSPAEARSQVAQLVVDYLLQLASPAAPAVPAPVAPVGPAGPAAGDEFFEPFVEMFLKEGSWWWTSHSDESGSSSWAAEAQRGLANPLPEGFSWGTAEDEFHLLSDEELIPPYYRSRHRPELTLNGSVVSSSTVTQLRYVQISVLQAAAGLNGWAVIKEEKAALAHAPDDGAAPVAALEIATKLRSRQRAWQLCGREATVELDAGDRCKAINAEAYDLALRVSSPAALERFKSRGRPLVMMPDKKPVPPAGPWWIWGYLKFEEVGEAVHVTSPYAFYPLDGPAYGAGNHYCKLLSPAMALEWIYIDSLRPRANTSLFV